MKNDLIYWAKRLYNAGLSPAKSGNLSIRKDNSILITASGSACADLAENEIVEIDFKGNLKTCSFADVNPSAGGTCANKKPSSEKFMHIKIYEKRPDIKAIIHSHSPVITAFAVSGLEISEPILPEFVLAFGKIPLAKYYLPSSIELAECVAEKFAQNNAVLMENHGIVIGGANLKEAFYALETIQSYAKTFIYAKLLGGAKPLNESALKDIEKLKSSF